MSEDSNLPSAIRDSDAVDDQSIVGSLSGRASSGKYKDDQSRIEVLELKLEQQTKVIGNMMEAFESLQTAFMERMENVASDLKNTKEELERCKEENDSAKKQLVEKAREILELKKKVQSIEVNFGKRFDSVQTGVQGQSKMHAVVCFSAKVEHSHNISPGTNTIVFKGAHTNVGNGYNSSNGEFTAPVGGHYVFYSNIIPQGGGRRVDTVLQVNGANKHNIYGGPKMEQGGSMMMVHLHAGEKVNIAKQGPWDGNQTNRPHYQIGP